LRKFSTVFGASSSKKLTVIGPALVWRVASDKKLTLASGKRLLGSPLAGDQVGEGGLEDR
jgi:hypothetical protein